MKWELHAHSSETSLCGHVPAADGVKWYAEKGYTGLVLMDHYNARTLDELSGTAAEKVKAWLRGYECALEAGEKYGLRVLFGLEARLPGRDNDFLIFGTSPEFLYAHANLYLGTLPELHRSVREAGGLLIQAHPFRKDTCYPENADDLDGVEVFNGCPRHESFNEQAEAFAELHPHLIRTSGSDFHRPEDLAIGGIETERDILTGRDLVACLKDGAYTLIRNTASHGGQSK